MKVWSFCSPTSAFCPLTSDFTFRLGDTFPIKYAYSLPKGHCRVNNLFEKHTSFEGVGFGVPFGAAEAAKSRFCRADGSMTPSCPFPVLPGAWRDTACGGLGGVGLQRDHNERMNLLPVPSRRGLGPRGVMRHSRSGKKM